MTPTLKPLTHPNRSSLSRQALTEATSKVSADTGPLTPILTKDSPDGTKHVQALVDSAGTPFLTYNRHPDDTITIIKNGTQLDALATAADQDPTTDMTTVIEDAILLQLLNGPHQDELAVSLTHRDATTDTAFLVKRYARSALAGCLQQGHPDNLPIHIDTLPATLQRTVQKKLLDPNLLRLCRTGSTSNLTATLYNQLLQSRDALLLLFEQHPHPLKYYLANIAAPQIGPPPTTIHDLANAIAKAANLTTPQETEAILHGFSAGRWARRQPSQIAIICRWAARLGPPGLRSTTLDTLDTLRERLPRPADARPQSSSKDRDAQRTRQYWTNVLIIYARDHLPTDQKTDLAWLRRQLTTTRVPWRTPQPPTLSTPWRLLREGTST